MAVSLLVTSGVHEAGLADTADAVVGAGDRAWPSVALKGSRVGALGAQASRAVSGLRVARWAPLAPDALRRLVAAQSVDATMGAVIGEADPR